VGQGLNCNRKKGLRARLPCVGQPAGVILAEFPRLSRAQISRAILSSRSPPQLMRSQTLCCHIIRRAAGASPKSAATLLIWNFSIDEIPEVILGQETESHSRRPHSSLPKFRSAPQGKRCRGVTYSEGLLQHGKPLLPFSGRHCFRLSGVAMQAYRRTPKWTLQRRNSFVFPT
jgi:hypothetical protein